MADADSSFYKIALASTDGVNVDCHFGRADTFYIYKITEEDYDFFEKRTVNPVCEDGKHELSRMEENVGKFTDCRYVVASRVGTAANTVLTSKGIKVVELPGKIEDAIYKVWKFDRVNALFEL